MQAATILYSREDHILDPKEFEGDSNSDNEEVSDKISESNVKKNNRPHIPSGDISGKSS